MDFKLSKHIYTDSDFDKMGWHDNEIHKMRLDNDLALDIDYILQWNKPDVEGLPFTFWIAPATLIFKNVHDLKFEFTTHYEDTFTIEQIERDYDGIENRWAIITRQGDFEFTCDGFEQFIRQEPLFEFVQRISHTRRFGHSFERTTNQINPNKNRQDILEARKKELELYETVKKRQLKKLELEALKSSKDDNTITTKEYLLKKKEINDTLFSYDFYLKGTFFENW